MGDPESLEVPVGQGEGEEEAGEVGRGRLVQGLECQASTLNLPLGRIFSREKHDQVCILARSFQLQHGKRMAGGNPEPCKRLDVGLG